MNKKDNQVKLEKVKTAQNLIYAALSLLNEATLKDDLLVMTQIRMPLRKLVEGRCVAGEFTLDDLIYEFELKIEIENE